MTNQEAIKMLTAKVECMKRETSGTDFDCNFRNCYKCDLNYEQGTIGKQIEALNMAISALESEWEEMIVICDNCGHAIHVKKVVGNVESRNN